MEKILVMFSQFSLLLFSTWSFYFARVESAFSNNKKSYGGQSHVLPLILITNLYSKFRRVFCPDSWDIRYTCTGSLSDDGIFPSQRYFRPNFTPFDGKLRACHLDKWSWTTAGWQWFQTGCLNSYQASQDDWIGHSVAQYCQVSDRILPSSDLPSSVTITLSRGNWSQPAPAPLSCLLLESNSARREGETACRYLTESCNLHKGEGIQMVTKVSLFISTTETEQKTSEQKRSRYCVAAPQ